MPYTTAEFAAQIKSKYPEYKGWDDSYLTDQILEKYPEYHEWFAPKAMGGPLADAGRAGPGKGYDPGGPDSFRTRHPLLTAGKDALRAVGTSMGALKGGVDTMTQFTAENLPTAGIFSPQMDPNSPEATGATSEMTLHPEGDVTAPPFEENVAENYPSAIRAVGRTAALPFLGPITQFVPDATAQAIGEPLTKGAMSMGADPMMYMAFHELPGVLSKSAALYFGATGAMGGITSMSDSYNKVKAGDYNGALSALIQAGISGTMAGMMLGQFRQGRSIKDVLLDPGLQKVSVEEQFKKVMGNVGGDKMIPMPPPEKGPIENQLGKVQGNRRGSAYGFADLGAAGGPPGIEGQFGGVRGKRPFGTEDLTRVAGSPSVEDQFKKEKQPYSWNQLVTDEEARHQKAIAPSGVEMAAAVGRGTVDLDLIPQETPKPEPSAQEHLAARESLVAEHGLSTEEVAQMSPKGVVQTKALLEKKITPLAPGKGKPYVEGAPAAAANQKAPVVEAPPEAPVAPVPVPQEPPVAAVAAPRRFRGKNKPRENTTIYHPDPEVHAEIKASLPVIAEALDKSVHTQGGFKSGDVLEKYGSQNGAREQLGLTGMDRSAKEIAAAIRRGKGNRTEMEVAKRIAPQIEDMIDARKKAKTSEGQGNLFGGEEQIPFDVPEVSPHEIPPIDEEPFVHRTPGAQRAYDEAARMGSPAHGPAPGIHQDRLIDAWGTLQRVGKKPEWIAKHSAEEIVKLAESPSVVAKLELEEKAKAFRPGKRKGEPEKGSPEWWKNNERGAVVFPFESKGDKAERLIEKQLDDVLKANEGIPLEHMAKLGEAATKVIADAQKKNLISDTTATRLWDKINKFAGEVRARDDQKATQEQDILENIRKDLDRELGNIHDRIKLADGSTAENSKRRRGIDFYNVIREGLASGYDRKAVTELVKHKRDQLERFTPSSMTERVNLNSAYTAAVKAVQKHVGGIGDNERGALVIGPSKRALAATAAKKAKKGTAEKILDMAYEGRRNLILPLTVAGKKITSDVIQQGEHVPLRGISGMIDQSGLRDAFVRAVGGKGQARVDRRLSDMGEHVKALFDPTVWKAAVDAATAGWNETAYVVNKHSMDTQIPGPAGKIIRIPQRALAVPTNFAMEITRGTEQRVWANETVANKKGLSPSQASAMLEKLAHLPLDQLPGDVQHRIVDMAAEKVLLGEMGKVAKGIQAARQSLRLRWLSPFLQVGMNMIKATYQRTPLYVGEIAYKARTGGMKGGEVSDALAKPILWTPILMGLLMAAKAGLISGPGPADKGQQYNKQAYWGPDSFKVGDTWYSAHALGHVGKLMSLAGAYNEASNEKDAGKAAKMLWNAASENFDPSTLQDLGGILALLKWDDGTFVKRLNRTSGTLLSSIVIPRILSKIAEASDTNEEGRLLGRKTDIPEDPFWKGPLRYLQRDIPGMREDLPLLRGVTGKPITRDAAFPGENLINPFPHQTDRGDATVEKQFEHLGWLPKGPPSSQEEKTPVGKVKVPLTPEERNAVMDANFKATQRARVLIQDPDYLRLPAGRKQERLEKLYRQERERALQHMRASMRGRARTMVATEDLPQEEP